MNCSCLIIRAASNFRIFRCGPIAEKVFLLWSWVMWTAKDIGGWCMLWFLEKLQLATVFGKHIGNKCDACWRTRRVAPSLAEQRVAPSSCCPRVPNCWKTGCFHKVLHRLSCRPLYFGRILLILQIQTDPEATAGHSWADFASRIHAEKFIWQFSLRVYQFQSIVAVKFHLLDAYLQDSKDSKTIQSVLLGWS